MLSTINSFGVSSGTLTWSPIAVKDMISQISVIISLQGSAELLEDITSSILHRDIVNIRTKGTFSLPSYSGPLLRTNDEVSMWIHLPTLKKSEDSAQDISEENVEASGGINGIKLTRVTSIGDGAINLPCLFQDKDCINPSTMLANQGVSVGSTLNVSLPRIDFNFGFTFQISLPNLGLSTSLSPIRRAGDVIERSDSWPLGKVVLNGVSMEAQMAIHLQPILMYILRMHLLLEKYRICREMSRADVLCSRNTIDRNFVEQNSVAIQRKFYIKI